MFLSSILTANFFLVCRFTYLAKKEHEPLLEVIYNIKSNFRWFLSGTPKHGDFNDVNSLACLLGIHLGIDELLPSVKLSKKYLKDKESTGFEGMSYYLESRSLQWHTRRHDLGQKFLDRFVRQNIAEIDEIPFEEHQCKISLPPAERAIYMELEAHLESLDMNHSKRLGKRKCVGDRDRRMQTILQTSESGEESLIKCCCHFNMSSDSTAPDTLEQIIDLRADEMEKLIEEMTAKVRNAFQKRQQVLAYQPDWSSVSTTGKGEVQDSLRGYLDDVNNSKSVFQGADDDVHAIIMKVADDAKLAFERENLSKKSNGPRVRVEDMDEDEQFELKHTLRNDIHIVRSLGKEVCGRQRSLRFVKNIQNVLRIESGNIEYCNLDCKHNHSPEQGSLSANEVGSIPRCGHMACMRCLGEEHVDEKCVVPHCRAKVERSHIVCFSTFSSVTNHNNNSRSRFGEKITAIIAKVQEIIETHNERLIIFCQYDDLQAKVKQALSERDIDSLQVKGTVNQQISVVSMFQKENWGESDPYVLLLKMDDEQSAGLNLTVRELTHAIQCVPGRSSTKIFLVVGSRSTNPAMAPSSRFAKLAGMNVFLAV